MELSSLGDIICSYPWRCIECKICEVCQQKGDYVRFQILVLEYGSANDTSFTGASSILRPL